MAARRRLLRLKSRLTGFNRIILGTRSAEKLAAMRSREITSLQNKLAACEVAAGASAERARRDADADAERTRARLQTDITALTLQNKLVSLRISYYCCRISH